MKRRAFLLALGLAGTAVATAVTVEPVSRPLRARTANGTRRRSSSGFGPLPLAGSGMTFPF